MLFPVCRCGRESCDRCSIFQLTPRTAAALWCAAQLLSDQAYDDIETHGSEPVTDRQRWNVFGDYPIFTWKQDAQWRRQAARAFDDLAGDLAAGREPLRTCPAEEMALYLTLDLAEGIAADTQLPLVELLRTLPEHPDDLDWGTAKDQLLLDTDVDYMLDLGLDGLERPDSRRNRLMGWVTTGHRHGSPRSWMQSRRVIRTGRFADELAAVPARIRYPAVPVRVGAAPRCPGREEHHVPHRQGRAVVAASGPGIALEGPLPGVAAALLRSAPVDHRDRVVARTARAPWLPPSTAGAPLRPGRRRVRMSVSTGRSDLHHPRRSRSSDG